MRPGSAGGKRELHRIGVDVVEIERIQAAVLRFGPRFLQRIYTGPELLLCKDKANRLAVRFAGKEAVMKALGTGVKGISWQEIEIMARPSGEPVVRLSGKAEEKAAALGLVEFAISLSHSEEYAVAGVIASTA
jgi:holo-[acyl-carrier protein] synthase